MNVKEALRSISINSSPPVFFLKGNDHFLQNFIIQKLLKIFFNDSPYSKTLFLPDDIKGKEIVEKISTTDLFEKNKLFIIREPQKIVGKPSIDLIEICKNPNPGSLIFLIIDDWYAKNSFASKIGSYIEPIDTRSPFEKDMLKWAKYLIKEKNKIADSEVISFLVDIAGDSIVHLNNEIHKICLLIEPRKQIKVQDLEQLSGWERERGLWEFLIAFSKKNYEKSVEIGRALCQNGNQLTSIIISLSNFYQEMLFIKMKKDGTFSQTNSFIPLPNVLKKKITYIASNFSKKEIKCALHLLNEIDQRRKSQTTDDEVELIMFIGKSIG